MAGGRRKKDWPVLIAGQSERLQEDQLESTEVFNFLLNQ